MQDTTFIKFWIIILSLNMNNRELGTIACTVKVKYVVVHVDRKFVGFEYP